MKEKKFNYYKPIPGPEKLLKEIREERKIGAVKSQSLALWITLFVLIASFIADIILRAIGR